MNKKLLFSPQACSKRPPLLLILQAKKEEVLQTKKRPTAFVVFAFTAVALFCSVIIVLQKAKDLIGSENVLFYQIVKRWFGRPCFYGLNVLKHVWVSQQDFYSHFIHFLCFRSDSNFQHICVGRQDLLISEGTT